MYFVIAVLLCRRMSNYMQYNMSRYIIFILLFIAVVGCNRNTDSLNLRNLYDFVEENPKAAIDTLNSIDLNIQTDADRHFIEFLKIKCLDKNYISHDNDSLILDVLKYNETHGPVEIYSEILYYAGRVYTDIGDCPTALKYYQLALDNLDDGDDDIRLKGRVLSQLGRLLSSLRMYKEAVPYIKEVIKLNRIQKDTLNEVYNLHLLGSVYRRMEDYKEAESLYRQAFLKSSNQGKHVIAKSKMHLADVLFYKGEIDSALKIIRNVPDGVNLISRDVALSFAAKIYEKADITDTAYMYAMELVNSKGANKLIGYNLLLSKKLRNKISSDSVDVLLGEYVGLLENYYDENENQLAVNQQAFYNYAIHDREKMKTQASVGKLVFWILISILAILSLGVIILLQGNRNKNNMLKLRDAIDEAARLQCVVNSLKEKDKAELKDSADEESCGCRDDCISKGESVSQLRKKLQRRLLELQKQCETDPVNLSPIITESGVYAKLTDIINSGKGIPDDDPIWDEVEEVVVESSPNFRKNMKLLLGDKNSSFDLHTTLLIKCGVSPSKMGILLNRTKGTIVSRRESLSMRMLDQKLGTRIIDDIIRLL